MIEKNIEVLRKILYAVETGRVRFTASRDMMLLLVLEQIHQMKKQSPLEQDSGMREKRNGFCRRSREQDPAQFKKIDTQNIEGDLS